MRARERAQGEEQEDGKKNNYVILFIYSFCFKHRTNILVNVFFLFHYYCYVFV